MSGMLTMSKLGSPSIEVIEHDLHVRVSKVKITDNQLDLYGRPGASQCGGLLKNTGCNKSVDDFCGC